MSPPAKTASIDFFADVVCPWCYVGWTALKAAAGEVSDEIRCSLAWRNFLLNPDMPAGGVDRKAYYAERFGAEPERIAQARAALAASAEALGVPLDLDAAERLPNTINAHRLIHWAAGQGLAEGAIDALFDAYFVQGDDIGDSDVLAAIGESAGLDPTVVSDLLTGDADRGSILRYHMAAQNIGVRGVPVVIINRQAVLMGAQTSDAYVEALRKVAA